jgi:hypothetical protein
LRGWLSLYHRTSGWHLDAHTIVTHVGHVDGSIAAYRNTDGKVETRKAARSVLTPRSCRRSCHCRDSAVRRDLSNGMIGRVCDVDVTERVHRKPGQNGETGGTAIAVGESRRVRGARNRRDHRTPVTADKLTAPTH